MFTDGNGRDLNLGDNATLTGRIVSSLGNGDVTLEVYGTWHTPAGGKKRGGPLVLTVAASALRRVEVEARAPRLAKRTRKRA